MSPLNRREFLGATAAFAASSAVAKAADKEAETKADKPAEPERPKRDPVRVAVMGLNGRGKGLVRNFLAFPEVEVLYLCDPDDNTLPDAAKLVTDSGRPAPKAIRDFRVALDDKHVDVLVCGAPDHWHALSTVLACQAGKDVYVEKPASHNLIEGRRMVEAARKYERIVQVGTQRRSSSEIIEAMEMIHGGRLGKIPFCRCWITSTRPNIGKVEPSASPSHLDFDLWAGPAPGPQYKSNLVHYHWHWRWDYGTGECGNNGIHALDVARWGLAVDSPRYITCGGDKYFFDDDQETPDTQVATFDFDGTAIQWEHRTWSNRGIDGDDFGIVFYGTKASLFVHNKGWTLYEGDKVVDSRSPGERELAHTSNFLDCRLSRELPHADVEIGHLSTSLCHLANIAWRTRSTIQFDGKTESIIGNDKASALLGRAYRAGFELPSV